MVVCRDAKEKKILKNREVLLQSKSVWYISIKSIKPHYVANRYLRVFIVLFQLFLIRLLASDPAIDHRPSQYAMNTISIRFLVDEGKKRVVFAEAGSDFMDVLFSFLTQPLGSIVRILGKPSGLLESLDNLYESVEQLADKKLLQTEACKQMLLNPRYAVSIICDDWMINNTDDEDPRNIYLCNERNCSIDSKSYHTYLPKVRCPGCGKVMEKVSGSSEEKAGVFLKDEVNFILTDDLRVVPVSLNGGLSLLKEFSHVNENEDLLIKDGNLAERVMDFNAEEILNLMRRSLVSKHVLTEVFFSKECTEEQSIKRSSPIIKESAGGTADVEKKVNMTILLNRKNGDVLYAQVGGAFVNQLLSFLTLPLASMLNQLGHHISLEGCISNLYSSAKSLELKYFKSKKRKNMLISPKIASDYECSNKTLKLAEKTSENEKSEISCLNLRNGGLTDFSGAFVKESRRFMVADNLRISPVSFISAIITETKDFFIPGVFEAEEVVGHAQVLSLLNAMLVSNTVLTDVFFPETKLWTKCTNRFD